MDWRHDADTGATNRKLSDMLTLFLVVVHGKDLSKADVHLTFCFKQETENCNLSCAIGDDIIDEHPYQELVDIAADYIKSVGGFEKFAEWGLF